VKFFKHLYFFIFSFLSTTILFAQNNIVFSGKISNTRNQPVSGASISIAGISKEGGLKLAADADGNFRLSVPPGKYSVGVTAAGYQPKIVDDVTVAEGMDNTIEIVLEYSTAELEGVVVKSTRKKEGTNALLSFQKNNTSLSSGLAADFIRRTPDKNTGEVLKRVSGASIQDNKFVIVRGLSDRYNSAMINGAILPSTEPDKKAFSFDVVPSSLVDNIIINKTATPEMTGEFTGGLIQITTKDIPTKNLLSFGLGFGFNTQSFGKDFIRNKKGSTDALGFDDGQRDLPSSYPTKYGEYNRLTKDERYAISQSFNDEVYPEDVSNAGPIQSYNLTWSNVEKFKNGHSFGSVIGLNYRNSKLLFPNVQRSVFETDGNNIFNYNDAQNRYSTTAGVIGNFAYSFGKTKIAFKNLFNQLFEDNYYNRIGNNNDNLQEVNLRSSFLNQRSLYSTQLELTHSFANKMKFSGNVNYFLNNKEQPDLRVTSYVRPIGSTVTPSLNNRGNNTNRFWSDLNDQGIGWQGKLEMPYTMKKNKQLVSIGGGSLLRVREFNAYIFGLGNPATSSYNQLPYDQIFKSENFGPQGFEYTTELQNITDSYFGASALTNGFVQFDNKLNNKLRIVWGIRAEYFEQLIEAPTKDSVPDVNTEKLDWLPSANLTYSLNNLMNIRFALSRTVARPEFREVAPFGFFNFEDLATVSGNPDLKRASIINADIRWEYYPKAGEILSFGVFAKSFKDPIELILTSNSGPSLRVYQFQNAKEALLVGGEFEFRKALGFLDKKEESWLDNLFFNGNVSLMYSKVSISSKLQGGDEDKEIETNRPLQGQSPYLINAGFQYNGEKGISLSLLYNVIGQRLSFVGNQSFGDIYEKPRNLLDFQVAQKILAKRGEIKLTISDILNQNFILYEKPIDKEKSAYEEGVDRPFTRYKFGTTFTIGFTYDLNL
jgi:hypothetical protein